MFNDDFWEDEEPGADPYLLRIYEDLKSGQAAQLLEEEDFEYIIDYFLQHDNEAEALRASDLALGYYPYSSAMLFIKAEVLFQAQRFGQSLQTLDEADRLAGANIESILLRSDLFRVQDKFQEAVSLLQTQIPSFDGQDKLTLMLELAEIYDENNNYNAVFHTLVAVLQFAPRNEEALHKLSFWADFTGFQQESVQLHQSILDKDPYNALAWFNLGAAYQGLKKHEEAIDAYEFCVAIDEKFEAAYRNMADAYIKLGWFEKAIESLEKHLELGTPEDVIYEAIGHCFEKQKDYAKARQYYQKSLRLNPADDLIFFRIGETYSKEAEWEKAAHAYSTALSLNKENAACLKALGSCLIEMDASLEAIACFLSAIKLKPNNKGNWLALLKGLYQSGCYEELLLDAEAAADTVGEKVEFTYLTSLALFSMGKTKEALLHLENALSQAPGKIKLILDLQPDLLQRKAVIQLLAKYKQQKR